MAVITLFIKFTCSNPPPLPPPASMHTSSSEMSWSDCLELGLKSSKNGYQSNAKYWMETALEKIPIVGQQQQQQQQQNSTEAEITGSTTNNVNEFNVKARLEVLRALLNVEYKSGKSSWNTKKGRIFYGV